MAKFIKFSGNYEQVAGSLGFNGFYAPQDTEALYEIQIEKDIPRTCYFSFSHTVASMQESLRIRHTPLSFTQGNFDGGVFTETQIKTSEKFFEYSSTPCPDSKDLVDSLRIAYVDDAGSNCAFSVAFLRDDSNLLVPVEKRKFLYSIAIIKNSNSAPQDREATYIAHEDLLADGLKANPKASLNARSIPEEVDTLLNSKTLSVAIQGLFIGESLSKVKFDELQARLVCNRNFDNRDEKQAQLDELLRVARRTLPNGRLEDYFMGIEKRAKHELDFFKDSVFERTIETVFNKVKKAISTGHERLVYENELTLHAIKLELGAQALQNQDDSAERDLRHRFSKEFCGFRDNGNLGIDKPIEEVIYGFEQARYDVNFQHYESKLAKYKNSTSELEKRYYCQGNELLTQIKAIASSNQKNTAVTRELSRVLASGALVLDDPRNMKHVAALTTLSQAVSGHASPVWKALGAGLLLLAGLALMVAGVLACLPSGGASLLLTVAGAAGVVAGAYAVKSSYTFFKERNETTGLSHAVADFQDAFTPKTSL